MTHPGAALLERRDRAGKPRAALRTPRAAFGCWLAPSRWLPPLPAATSFGEGSLPLLSLGEGLLWDREACLEQSVGACQGRQVRLLRYSPLGVPMRLSFEVEGRGRFDWDGDSGRIGFQCEPEARSLLSYWLLDHAIPFFLVSQGRFSLLHGGCAAVDGRGIAWIGPSGAGKTTLGGYALEMGHPFVADDKLAILRREGRWLVLPSHPYHRVDRVSETLGRWVGNFARGSVPLGLLCLLEPVAASEEPRIRLLSGREAFLRLSAHRGCRIRWREEEEFRLFSRLIHEVPVVACQVPRDRAKLRDLFSRMRRVLEEDFSEAAGAVASR